MLSFSGVHNKSTRGNSYSLWKTLTRHMENTFCKESTKADQKDGVIFTLGDVPNSAGHVPEQPELALKLALLWKRGLG